MNCINDALTILSTTSTHRKKIDIHKKREANWIELFPNKGAHFKWRYCDTLKINIDDGSRGHCFHGHRHRRRRHCLWEAAATFFGPIHSFDALINNNNKHNSHIYISRISMNRRTKLLKSKWNGNLRNNLHLKAIRTKHFHSFPFFADSFSTAPSSYFSFKERIFFGAYNFLYCDRGLALCPIFMGPQNVAKMKLTYIFISIIF